MIKLTNESGGLLFGPFADRQDAGRPPAVLPYALGIYWLVGDDSGCASGGIVGRTSWRSLEVSEAGLRDIELRSR
jgi:hypothetical protein